MGMLPDDDTEDVEFQPWELGTDPVGDGVAEGDERWLGEEDDPVGTTDDADADADDAVIVKFLEVFEDSSGFDMVESDAKTFEDDEEATAAEDEAELCITGTTMKLSKSQRASVFAAVMEISIESSPSPVNVLV